MSTTTNNRPAEQIIWPRAELRMIADTVAFDFIAGAVAGCLAEEQGGMRCLAEFYAVAWGTHERADVRALAATIREYAEAAMRAGHK